MFKFQIPAVACCENVLQDKLMPYESLGERIRNSMDQGVSIPTVNSLLYDEEADGDNVDPMADPRADFFDQAEGLDAIKSQALAEQRRQEQLMETVKASTEANPVEPTSSTTETNS